MNKESVMDRDTEEVSCSYLSFNLSFSHENCQNVGLHIDSISHSSDGSALDNIRLDNKHGNTCRYS